MSFSSTPFSSTHMDRQALICGPTLKFRPVKCHNSTNWPILVLKWVDSFLNHRIRNFIERCNLLFKNSPPVDDLKFFNWKCLPASQPHNKFLPRSPVFNTSSIQGVASSSHPYYVSATLQGDHEYQTNTELAATPNSRCCQYGGPERIRFPSARAPRFRSRPRRATVREGLHAICQTPNNTMTSDLTHSSSTQSTLQAWPESIARASHHGHHMKLSKDSERSALLYSHHKSCRESERLYKFITPYISISDRKSVV